MNNFTPFSVVITQELDAFILKALLSLIKTEQNADSIVQAGIVINYFNQARLSKKEEKTELSQELVEKSIKKNGLNKQLFKGNSA